MPAAQIENSEIPFGQVVSHFVAKGVSELFVKWLAPNDNSKNQVYVERGRGAEGRFNVFPTHNIRQERTQDGNNTIKAAVRFGWMDDIRRREMGSDSAW